MDGDRRLHRRLYPQIVLAVNGDAVAAAVDGEAVAIAAHAQLHFRPIPAVEDEIAFDVVERDARGRACCQGFCGAHQSPPPSFFMASSKESVPASRSANTVLRSTAGAA